MKKNISPHLTLLFSLIVSLIMHLFVLNSIYASVLIVIYFVAIIYVNGYYRYICLKI